MSGILDCMLGTCRRQVCCACLPFQFPDVCCLRSGPEYAPCRTNDDIPFLSEKKRVLDTSLNAEEHVKYEYPGTDKVETASVMLAVSPAIVRRTGSSPRIHGMQEKACASIPSPIDYGEECVICLGEFTKQNPVMPTLCSCGENRAKFHYPCLLLYLNKKSVCPSCNSTLFYQVSDTVSEVT
jgi:hypothetical protein